MSGNERRSESDQEAAIRFAQQAAEYAASRNSLLPHEAGTEPDGEDEPGDDSHDEGATSDDAVDVEPAGGNDPDEDHSDDPDGTAEPEPAPVRHRPPTFRDRVDLKVPQLRYANNLHRIVYSPEERDRRRQVDRHAALWIPLATVVIIGLCAVVAVALAVRAVGADATSPGERSLTVGAVAAVVVGCFVLLLRSQDHWESARPSGRIVRTDVADAYETVRDAPFVLVELGVDDERLNRVVDLLPVAERLVDFIVEHQSMSTMPIKTHPVYEELIRMSAEVQVIVEMRQEALGRRPLLTGDQWWTARLSTHGEFAGFESLADLAESIGPAPRRAGAE